MNLSDAIQFTFDHRPTWSTGKGSGTARINANHCLRVLGDIDLTTIESKHINCMSDQLLNEGKKPATVNRITAALSTILKTLRQYGYSIPDPDYVRQKEPKARPLFYSEEEMQKLLETASKLSDFYLLHDSILFSLKTGCRQGEMLELTADCVDLERGEMIFKDTKNGRDHYLPIPKDLYPIINRRMEYSISDRLFEWRDKDQLLRSLKAAQRDAGVPPGKVWHTIRHTTATWLCEKGVPLRAVMGVLNHSNVNTTLRYAKATLKSKADALDLL
jgi:integrase